MGDKEDSLDIEAVKAFISEHAEDPDVVAYIETISTDRPLKPELVTAYLQTSEGKSLIQPIIDQRVTDAIKTHDEKTKSRVDAAIKSGIAAEMLRLNPSETPDQKRLRELEEKDRKREEEWEQEKLNSRIKEMAFKLGIRPEFVGGIRFGSFEEASLWAQNFKAEKEAIEANKVNELLAQGYKPSSGAPEKQNKLDASKLSFEEAVRMEMNGELDGAIS